MDGSERARAFARVRAGSMVSWPCSPEIPDDPEFFGIRIDALEQVSFGAVRPLRLVVTGTLRVEDGYLGAPFPLDWVLFVAVDEATHHAYPGTMLTVVNRIKPPGTAPPVFEGSTVTLFFNPDLARTLQLPQAPASYLIYAALGDHVSNVLRVRVVDGDATEEGG